MMKYSFVMLSLMLVVSPLVAQADCGLEPRLIAGEFGQVTPGEANNVRAEPTRSAELIGQLPGGAVITVLDGPVCANGFTWWEVAFAQGGEQATGWTVESNATDYFLTPLEGQPVTYENVAFLLPAGIASRAEGAFIEAEMTSDESGVGAPGYVEFTFEDYPDDEHRRFDYPQLRVYTATAFEGIENMLGDTGRYAVEALAQVLAERPELYRFNVTDNRIPDDTPGAANTVLAKLGYLDFQNGGGYRYITAYAQDFVGPDNEGLQYRYLGLTDDGAYFVSGRFPVNSPELPEDFDRQATFDDADYGFGAFQEYALETAALFDAIPPEEYTPDLSQLDALIASLVIGDA
jgi:hypothetical protein